MCLNLIKKSSILHLRICAYVLPKEKTREKKKTIIHKQPQYLGTKM